MVIFEHLFDDTTGMRIVTMPNEAIKREETVIQLRVQTGPQSIKMVKVALTDPKTGEDLFPVLEEALLKNKLKEVGRQCDHCCEFYLPTSPNQKHCPNCKDMLKSKEEDN
jgi:hypothetical protein